MRFSFLAAVAALLFTTGFAHADSIVSSGSTLLAIANSTDTVTLNAGNVTVTSGNSFTIDGQFHVGSLPLVGLNIPLTFTDSLTVNGVTKLLTFTGTDLTALVGNTLTINALGPIQFGSAVLNFGSVSVKGGANTTLNFSLPVSYTGGSGSGVSLAATPEPSSLVLLGTGMLSAAVTFRRRFV